LIDATRQQEVIYKEVVEVCINMASDRALIEAATGQSLSVIEWTGLLLLLLLLMSLIAVLPGGTILGALVAGLMAGTLVTLIILLRKLDRLRWHERASIWEPTARLFRSMGRDPYVPRDVIESGRYRPTGRVRVADYIDPYPDRTRKIVTVEDFGHVEPPNDPGRIIPSLHVPVPVTDRCIMRLGQEVTGPLGVAGSEALGEHPPTPELSPGQEEFGAHPSAEFGGLGEVGLGVVMAPEHRGQASEVVTDGAEGRCTGGRHLTPPRFEPVEQGNGGHPVTAFDGGLGIVHHPGEPQLVEGEVEARGRERPQ
jgi:hypothetical protein